MRLSNSAIDTYSLCPMKYKLHYIDNIRSTQTGSALMFGGAIDSALNVLLLSKKRELTDEEAKLASDNPYRVFLREFRTATILDKEEYAPTSDNIHYYKSDCDLSVLSTIDVAYLLRSATKAGYDIETIPQFVDGVGKLHELSAKDLKLFHFISWHCLAKKGLLFIDAYKEQIMPQVVEVKSIQRKVHLPNANGNYLIGFIDFEATLSDGTLYVLDNKTAGSPYREDSVQNSQQLSIYGEYCENMNCGYVVLNKRLRKNEPRVRIQVITDTIKEEQVRKVFDKIGNVEYNIEQGNFEPNWDSCFAYGKPCSYYKYCRGGSVEGLRKLPEKKDGNDKREGRNDQGTEGQVEGAGK